MSDCCGGVEQSKAVPKKKLCPENNQNGLSVPYATILHHLKQPWKTRYQDQPWYFCDDPACDVVYFGADDSVITTAELRTEVGLKTKGEAGLLCYCYGVSKREASDPLTKAFVVAQTKQKNCACDTKNPSGRCCLKYFSSSL